MMELFAMHRAILGTGVAFGFVATFLWGSFVILAGWSVCVLFVTGTWPERPVSFDDVQIADLYGGAWVGWYMLGGAIFALLITFGCLLASRQR
jgi:hypothetical protein